MKVEIMRKYLTICAVVLLSACASDTLFPQTDTDKIVSTPASEKVRISGNTGTAVGRQAADFKNELNQIRAGLAGNELRLAEIRRSITENTAKYHDMTASMQTKLQLGTTPSNPQMVGLLNNAGNLLEETGAAAAELNNLAAETAALGTKTASLAANIKATYAVPGAVDEDHANLRVLENAAEQTAVAAKNQLQEISEDARYQKQAVHNERMRLFRLNDAVARGSFGVDNPASPDMAFMSPQLPAYAPSAPAARQVKARKALSAKNQPIYRVRFDSDDIRYQAEMDSAVKKALQANPRAKFEIVGVNPRVHKKTAEDSKRYAAEVFANIINMGVGPEDIILRARTDNSLKVPEVLVYVR